MSFAKGWHPVALSTSVEPGSSAGTQIDGREYVVWRDNNGVAHVWEDRCPHRGMKLSASASCAAIISPASITAGSTTRPASAATSRRIPI